MQRTHGKVVAPFAAPLRVAGPAGAFCDDELALGAGEHADHMAGLTRATADHVRDAHLVLRVGGQRRIAGGRQRVKDVDVLDRAHRAGVDAGDLHEGLRPLVRAAVDVPGEPELVVHPCGTGQARVGAVEPAAIVRRARDVAVAADPARHGHIAARGLGCVLGPAEDGQRAGVGVRCKPAGAAGVLRHPEALQGERDEGLCDDLAVLDALQRDAHDGRSGARRGPAEQVGRHVQVLAADGQIGKV